MPPAVMTGQLSLGTRGLREEASESWQSFLGDRLVYGLKVLDFRRRPSAESPKTTSTGAAGSRFRILWVNWRA